MTFFSLVAALLLEQLRPLRTGNRLYVAFARYVNRLAHSFNAGHYRDGVISWMLAVVPLALVTLIVYLALHHVNALLALLWNIAVLYLALGFRQFSHFYTEIMAAHCAAMISRAHARCSPTWRGGSAREFTAAKRRGSRSSSG